MPYPHEAAAAEVVKGYLRRVEQPPAPRRGLQEVFAERINYCRQFDQSKMPDWSAQRMKGG
jgi:hypothetical protein